MTYIYLLYLKFECCERSRASFPDPTNKKDYLTESAAHALCGNDWNNVIN